MDLSASTPLTTTYLTLVSCIVGAGIVGFLLALVVPMRPSWVRRSQRKLRIWNLHRQSLCIECFKPTQEPEHHLCISCLDIVVGFEVDNLEEEINPDTAVYLCELRDHNSAAAKNPFDEIQHLRLVKNEEDNE